jgi:plastocyanin
MTTLQKKNLNTWMNRFVAWVLIVLSCVLLGGKAYAAEIQMGADGMLVFEPCELTVDVGEKVTFINNELPPHNVMFADYQELSHGDLMFSAGESFDVTFEKAGDYYFQCDPHAGAGMKGVIHVE